MARSTKDNSSAEIPTRPRYYHDSSAQQITPSRRGENLMQCQRRRNTRGNVAHVFPLPLPIVLSHLARHSGRAREHTHFARDGAEARTKDVRSSRHKNQSFPPPADIHTAHTTSPPTSPSPKSLYQQTATVKRAETIQPSSNSRVAMVGRREIRTPDKRKKKEKHHRPQSNHPCYCLYATPFTTKASPVM